MLKARLIFSIDICNSQASNICIMSDYEFDFARIFLGDKPPLFFLEVAFRTLIIFSYTLLLLRWMGKRGMGQLTPFEFAIIVALGSAVGDPMFYDDVPLLHTMLVIAIIIGLQRFLSYITETNKTIEAWIEGEAVCLVQAGVVDIKKLQNERLSQTELFDALRTHGIVHLGQVRAAYLECSGKISVIRAQPTRAGLCILPNEDFEREESLWRVAASQSCCATCGKIHDPSGPADRCGNCGDTQRIVAIADADAGEE